MIVIVVVLAIAAAAGLALGLAAARGARLNRAAGEPELKPRRRRSGVGNAAVRGYYTGRAIKGGYLPQHYAARWITRAIRRL